MSDVEPGVIVTLTANPSVDQTVMLHNRLQRGAVQRISHTTSQAGGKGVNISRAAVRAGVPTVAVLPAGADDPFVLELTAAGIACRPSTPAGEVRTNLTITEADGTTTKLNSPGAAMDAEHLEALSETVALAGRDAAWVVLAGSLPPGAPPHFYADLAARLGRHARVAVDTSDLPLRVMCDRLAVSAPDVMKPNAEELVSVFGGDAERIEDDPAAAASLAAELVDRGVGAVLATLGGNGAVLVDRSGAWHASPPPTEVLSTVGAGDSSLFGYILGDLRGLPGPERLALAVAYGSAAASLPGTGIPAAGDVDPAGVRVDELVVR